MRDFMEKCLRELPCVPKFLKPSYKYPLAWPLCEVEFGRPEPDPQAACPLFNKLSAELRVSVYQAVLTDPHRFLHIIKKLPRRAKRKRARREVAHFWCVDMESPFPTFQHDACYGEYRGHNLPCLPFSGSRPITETDNKLLSLLLTCRIVYSEALSILYQENTFHFRGAACLLAFRSSISTVQWNSIRNIHISTLFACMSEYPNIEELQWPPESFPIWETCCQLLRKVPNLRSLTLDMMALIDTHHPELPDLRAKVEGSAVLSKALEPLKDIKALVLEVELNFEPSQKMWSNLGEANFVTTWRKRPYNVEVYGISPELPVIR